MKTKNNRGVTLVALTVAVIVLIILTSITIYGYKNQLALKYLNYLYSDIESISTKVSAYYIKTGELPVYDNAFIDEDDVDGVKAKDTREVLKNLLIKNGGTSENELVNTNDDSKYYVVDLTKLDNLTLNYGQNYRKWRGEDNPSFDNEDYQDLYIINSVTHQVYYPAGISYDGKYYFSNIINESKIEPIVLNDISDYWSVNLNGIDQIDEDDDKITLSANVTVNLTKNYNENSLEYAWSEFNTQDQMENIEFSQFSLNSLKSAILTSKQIDKNYDTYYLLIKVTDINGISSIKYISVNIEEL